MRATDDTDGRDGRPDADPSAWTDADALIRAGWRSGPDLAERLGISVRTLQRRARRGEVRRVQIGRETFYAKDDTGDMGDSGAETFVTGRGARAARVDGVEESGDSGVPGGVGRGASAHGTGDRRHHGARHADARGATDGVAALLDLVRELREALVDAERRAAVAAAERDALRAVSGVAGDVAVARRAAGGGAVGSASRIEATSASSQRADGPHEPPLVSDPSLSSGDVAAEVHRLRGVVQRRTADLEAARQRVESVEHELARVGLELSRAHRERDEALAEAAAARVARDEARAARDGALAARDAAVAVHDASRTPGVPAGGVIVAGETIPFSDVEARMKQLVIERNEYRLQAKEFRDQRRQLERDIKQLRRSRNAGRRIDDSGWSKR